MRCSNILLKDTSNNKIQRGSFRATAKAVIVARLSILYIFGCPGHTSELLAEGFFEAGAPFQAYLVHVSNISGFRSYIFDNVI